MRMVLIFCMIILQLMCGAVCRVLAKAPTTPKILFTSTRDGNREVYMMNPDGSEQVNLTQHRADDLGAVWSPTGEQILFVSDRQGTRVWDLYLMDADGQMSGASSRKKQKVGDIIRHGLPMANSLLTVTGTGIVSSSVCILERLAKRMPNFSRMGVPRRGLLTVQKSLALYLINSDLGLYFSTLTHAIGNNRSPIKHSCGNPVRLGLVRETDLPFLGTSIHCRSSWIGICTTHGRIKILSSSSTVMARVSATC